MDKILVVGGAGYIGSHISNSIPRQNLVILDDLSAGNKQSVPEDCLYVGDTTQYNPCSAVAHLRIIIRDRTDLPALRPAHITLNLCGSLATSYCQSISLTLDIIPLQIQYSFHH